jgi:hypothetical protein
MVREIILGYFCSKTVFRLTIAYFYTMIYLSTCVNYLISSNKIIHLPIIVILSIIIPFYVKVYHWYNCLKIKITISF